MYASSTDANRAGAIVAGSDDRRVASFLRLQPRHGRVARRAGFGDAAAQPRFPPADQRELPRVQRADAAAGPGDPADRAGAAGLVDGGLPAPLVAGARLHRDALSPPLRAGVAAGVEPGAV